MLNLIKIVLFYILHTDLYLYLYTCLTHVSNIFYSVPCTLYLIKDRIPCQLKRAPCIYYILHIYFTQYSRSANALACDVGGN